MIPHSAPWVTGADRQAVDERLRRGMIASGTAVAEFEAGVRQYVKAEACFATHSGADAIKAALEVLGLGQGDDVILPTYVCESVMQSIQRVGATPVFADVNERSVLDVRTVGAAITPATKAIIAVHAFGHLCDIPSLRSFSVPIIEDACQAFGLETPWGMTGVVGDLGVYSFHATKCLTTGEGGMLLAGGRSQALLLRARSPESARRLSDLQAALGLAQLGRYEEFLARRLALRLRLDEAFAHRPHLIAHLPPAGTFLFRYTIRSEAGFEAAQAFFGARGVTARRGVDSLLHRQAGRDDRDFPTAVEIFGANVSIPFHAALADHDADRVVRAAEEFANAQ